MVAWLQSEKKQQRAFKAGVSALAAQNRLTVLLWAGLSSPQQQLALSAAGQYVNPDWSHVIFAPLSSGFPKLLHFGLHLRVRLAGLGSPAYLKKSVVRKGLELATSRAVLRDILSSIAIRRL